MSVFEDLRNGKSYDIRDEQYIKEAYAEMARCRHLCWKINNTDPNNREEIITLERELFKGDLQEGSFLTPPFQIDFARCIKMGKNVFANHGLTVMSIGTIIIEDGVMFGPEVGLFTVNHEPKNIRVIMTKEIHVKRNAWIGARVNILPGVTIGENAIIGTGSVVTKDIPDNCVAVGVPAKIIKEIS
ncbi:sugar O-acetyltransferase [bacterium]|nr:sugar O-acetyltransferase [bacterium]